MDMPSEDKVEIYGKHGCSRCVSVKNLIDKRGIDYIYTSIEDMKYPDKIRDLVILDNNGMYPLLMINGEVVSLKDVLNMGK